MPILLNLRDLRDAARKLGRAPARTALIVLTLAVGIGANSAVFSFVNAVILRPPAIPHLDRAVSIWETDTSRPEALSEPSYPAFLGWEAEAHHFERLAAMSSVNLTFVWNRAGEPLPIRGRVVSEGFFDVLGVAPAIGRSFRPEEMLAGAPARVVVISHGLWERSGASPSILGTVMVLNAKPFHVVGVMPRGFRYPLGADLWTPLVPEYPELAADVHVGWLQVIGRLKPDITVSSARGGIDTLVKRANPSRPGRGATVVPLAVEIFGQSRTAVAGLFGATLLILVLSCVNVSNVLLAGAAATRREDEIRLALGATRGRIAVRHIAEALLLTACGGAIGVATAASMLAMLKRVAPADFVHLEYVTIDARVMAVSTLLLLIAAVIVCVAPVFASPAAASALVHAPAQTGTPRERRWRDAYAVSEIAIALVVLMASVLIIRSFLTLSRQDLGFDPRGVLTFAVDVPDDRYPTMERKRAFHAALLERIAALPEVVAAGAAYLRPLEYGTIGMDAPIVIEGQDLRGNGEKDNPLVNWEVVTPGYFEALGVRLLGGRTFTPDDRADGDPVVVLGESAARRLWPGESAIGKHLNTIDGPVDAQGHPRWQRIVGIVADVRYREITGTRLDVYLPASQGAAPTKSIVVKTTGDPLALLPRVRAIVHAMDPQLPIDSAAAMADVVSRVQAPWRFNALLFGVFGGLAVLLAGLGVFGVLMCAVVERGREFAIRRAMGARREDVVRLIARQVMVLMTIGLAIGALVAIASARGLASLLFGVAPIDPWSLLLATGLIVAVGAVASWFPARRALRADALEILRT